MKTIINIKKMLILFLLLSVFLCIHMPYFISSNNCNNIILSSESDDIYLI